MRAQCVVLTRVYFVILKDPYPIGNTLQELTRSKHKILVRLWQDPVYMGKRLCVTIIYVTIEIISITAQ